jgi:hypothetical protein
MADGDGPFTIRVEGHLDICAAGKVVERLRLAPDDREVTIDLAPRAQCDLVALSYIAEAIERRSGRTFVRGLSGHDTRILEYLGVELPAGPKSPQS